MANRTRPGHGAVGAYNHPPAPARGRCPPRPAPAHGPGHGAVRAYHHPPAPARGRCPPRPAPAYGPGHGAVRAYHYPPAPAHGGRCPPRPAPAHGPGHGAVRAYHYPPAPAHGGGYPHARAYGGNRGNAPARYDRIVADGMEGLAMGAAGAAAIMSGGNPPPLDYGKYQNHPFIPFVAVGVEALAAAFTNNFEI